MRRLATAFALLVIVISLGVVAGSASATPLGAAQVRHADCFFPKTKFVLHAGLAFGAFHRYLYKPFKAGDFTGPDKVKVIAKAAVAAAFIYHEVGEALKQAQCSHTLAVLVTPLTALTGAIKTATDQLKAGGLPDISQLGTAFDAIGTQAGGVGTPIKDLIQNL